MCVCFFFQDLNTDFDIKLIFTQWNPNETLIKPITDVILLRSPIFASKYTTQVIKDVYVNVR